MHGAVAEAFAKATNLLGEDNKSTCLWGVLTPAGVVVVAIVKVDIPFAPASMPVSLSIYDAA